MKNAIKKMEQLGGIEAYQKASEEGVKINGNIDSNEWVMNT